MRKKAGNCFCFAAITTLVPTLALATGGEMELESPFTLLMRLVNFLLLAALLYYFLRKPIKNFLVQRQQGVREALEEAQRAAKEAEARYKEMEKKLAQAHKEMEELKNMIIEQGKQEKERILARAHKEAERIIKQAELAAEQELKKAYSSIRLEAVEMAAAIAEAILKDKIDSKDHKRLIEQYVENVGKMTS
jgi:F-type H+-transporting ATPase subunit b